VRLVGSPERLALHGGSVPPGATPVLALAPSAPADAAPSAPTGGSPGGAQSAPAGGVPSADVVWCAAPADAVPGVRTIAPGGTGLWRRAPLPAADALFALPLATGSEVLVAGGEAGQREAALAALGAVGIEARAVALPAPADLAGAAVVAAVGEQGAPLPALALPALAAGALLLAPRADPSFGLAPGIDHLPYAHPDEMARLALAALRHPAAFAPVRALGRASAEAHRASVVLARLA
jgi:hypothetical protein